MNLPVRSCVVLVLLLCLAPMGLRAEEPGVHVDEEYRFKLEPPSSRWRVLGESDIQAISPDAIAGMVGPGGTWMAVIAESVPEADLEPFAQLILDNMPLEEKRVESFQKTTFQGKPAVRFVVSGLISELAVRYVNTVYQSGDYIFQVIAWHAANSPLGSTLVEQALRAYRVLPGEVRGRQGTQQVPDSEGVGWRVRDGAFESAALALAVRPQGRWRVIVGGELEAMNADAEVGLAHTGPDVYAVLIVEPAAGVDRKAFIESVMSGTGEEDEAEPTGYRHALRIGDRKVDVLGFESPAAPGFEMLRGAFFHGDLCVQIALWYARPNRKAATPLLQQACDSVQLLTAPQVKALAEALRGGPDPENKVGAQFALRRGTYRDFTYGFELRKPADQYWRFRAGDEARVQNPDASLALEHPTLGVFGIVIAEEAGEFDAKSYHAVVTEGLFEGEGEPLKVERRTLQVDGASMQVSEADDSEGGLDLRYCIATTVRNGYAYQFLFHGLSRNLRSSVKRMDELLGGLSFHASLPRVDEQAGRYTDHRMGFRLDAGSSWTRRDQTPPGVEPLGTFQTWKRGDELQFVLALCALSPGQDADWFRSMLGSVMARLAGERMRVEPERMPATVAGIEGELLRWSTGGGRTNSVWLVSRDRTFYALALVSESGFPPEATAGFLRRFQLTE